MSQKSIIVLIASLITAFASASFASTAAAKNNAAENCRPALVLNPYNISTQLSGMANDKNVGAKFKDEFVKSKDELVKLKDEMSLPIVKNIRIANWIASDKTDLPIFNESCEMTTTKLGDNTETHSVNIHFKIPTKVSVEIIRHLKDGKIKVVKDLINVDPAEAVAAFKQMRAYNKSIKSSSLKEKLANKPVFSTFKDATVRIDESKDKDLQSVTNDVLKAIGNAISTQQNS